MIAALVAISGCGSGVGDGGIPSDTAESMLSLTQRIDDANANGDCDTAAEATTELRNQVDGLGAGETKEALGAMVTQLDENLDADCAPEGPTGEADAKPEEETTTSVPVEPETTVPTTTTTETTEPPPEEEPPPEQPPNEGGGPNGPPQTAPGQGGGTPPTGGIEE
jgi:hypothetical protein